MGGMSGGATPRERVRKLTAGRMSVRHAVPGPSMRVFNSRVFMKIKTRFYAGNLVFQGPSGTYGVGQIRRRGRVPDGLPDRSSDAARNATQAGATFAGHEISNLIVSPARFSHVGPSGPICRRARRIVIEIRQIWGWVS